jgi:beta-glucosidase
VSLRPGEKRRVTFTLAPRQLSLIDAQGRRVVAPGDYEISVGGKQPGFSGLADAATTGVATARLTIAGEPSAVAP